MVTTLTAAHNYANELSPEEEQPHAHHTVRGRISRHRALGGVTFFDLQDHFTKLQIQARNQDLCVAHFNEVGKLHVGDIVEVTGFPIKTTRGEPSLRLTGHSLLQPCIRPLPDKYHGLSDIEKRARERELDLVVNQDSALRLKTRSNIIKGIRHYLDDLDYLEIETPILQPQYGGANAKPFETKHESLDQNMYLRIAPELYLKRAMIGGFERIFEIGKCFRNEGISRRHNPEFTSLEFYTAYADWREAAEITEDLIKSITPPEKEWSNEEWDRIYFHEAIEYACNIDIYKHQNIVDLYKAMHDKKIKVPQVRCTWIELVDSLFEQTVEPQLKDPTFVCDYPIEMSPLAKAYDDRPNIAERWELYIEGMEIANGYTELTDPQEQRSRMEVMGNLDNDYIHALELGLPPCAGVGIGIDRLTMLLTDTSSIRDTIMFPHLRTKE